MRSFHAYIAEQAGQKFTVTFQTMYEPTPGKWHSQLFRGALVYHTVARKLAFVQAMQKTADSGVQVTLEYLGLNQTYTTSSEADLQGIIPVTPVQE